MGQRIGHSILRQPDGHYSLCSVPRVRTGLPRLYFNHLLYLQQATTPYPGGNFEDSRREFLQIYGTKDLETFTQTACIG